MFIIDRFLKQFISNLEKQTPEVQGNQENNQLSLLLDKAKVVDEVEDNNGRSGNLLNIFNH